MKILIIDDNKDLATALQKLLSVAGLGDVYCAFGGIDGIATARDLRPDLVLVDLSMPGMDGFAVSQAIARELPSTVPTFVAITGHGSESFKKLTREKGFSAHLTKPFMLDDVRRVIESLPLHCNAA